MLIKGGIKNSLGDKVLNLIGRPFNKIIVDPFNRYLTTKYSPLPLNARLYLRSRNFPDWDFGPDDFRKSEINILSDLAALSSVRQNSWKDGSTYPVERNVYYYPEKFNDNKRYRIKEWDNAEITGKELKDIAQDYMSTGISFHDYDALRSMMNKSRNILGRERLERKYSDKQINQMQNFANDNKFMRAYHSFTNPLYAVRTGIGRAQLIPYGKIYPKGIRENYVMNDVFDFDKINKNDFPMSDDYYKLHKEAEDQTYPIRVRANLGY